jgi:two-component system NtrC family response regulator
MPQGHILVVDDERPIGQLVQRSLTRLGHRVVFLDQPEEALELLKHEAFDLVITDLRMPGIDGIEFLSRSKRIRPGCEVLLMTGFASVETALEALKRGAIDYIQKPFSVERDLAPIIDKILSAPAGSGPVDDPVAAASDTSFVAESPAMQDVVRKASRIAKTAATVLLTGESGTGKEVIARFIHAESDRADRELVSVNCAALPDTLLESELFGHKKGSFTGATADRRGFFEVANGGTILLDEIGEISSTFQPKLLRVLETGEFHRVGDASKAIVVDVRVIAATNRDLESAVRAGEFRKDLFYRLNVLPLVLPPLRERRGDVIALIERSLHDLPPHLRIADAALERLRTYPWPGNVRELRNAMQHAAVLCDSDEIQLSDLPAAIQDFQSGPPDAGKSTGEQTLAEIEIQCIRQAMQKSGLNRTRAAKLLGVSRRTLGYRIEKYGLADTLEAERGAH